MTIRHDLAARIIHHAAQGCRSDLAERLEEEWLADLSTRPSTLARLRFALGCCWAVCVIAHEHGWAEASVATSPSGAKNMTVGISSHLPRRTSVVFLVLCLHVGIVYLLASGLATRVISLAPTSLTAVLSQEPQARPQPPPPPPPTFERVQPDLPVLPDIVINDTFGDDETIHLPPCEPIHGCTPPPPVRPAPPPVVRTAGGVGPGFPSADDYYPPAAIRLGLEGIAGVHVCVNEKGRLSEEPTLAESSKVASIDAAALRLARVGSGHYRPATENGQPVNSCFTFRIRFNFRN